VVFSLKSVEKIDLPCRHKWPFVSPSVSRSDDGRDRGSKKKRGVAHAAYDIAARATSDISGKNTRSQILISGD